ncbi:hypothetical protein CfE428DRAFT_5844 [Chthoniobacter flavus Ellin428]|uniref:Uncharacterized protein n=1 Tax=Chthoniobacter flavus Ellin428 TaxID=497964 RepID=B4DAA4_9BACT|nr:hypothetical protein [Chthoniobacter flavus]EDY16565.1 hypothetical protein CfE428DRAFT_5844 [Chthoniobacter flavus Ellin428]TCO92012.1 hypothetical protein EV701_107295 [Chthoniobacter flavus]
MKQIRPMDAVAALYSDGDHALSEAIIASLSRAIFVGGHFKPAGPAKRALAKFSYRVLKWTTTRRKGDAEKYCGGAHHNPILERTGHPYARALLDSSREEHESLVEGGDPMNGPYMLISPEIRKASDAWDRIFMDSVQSRDVQLRFAWETQATYEVVKSRLQKGGVVRVKALAAGTGLSTIIVYDRLIRDGCDPARMIFEITDRDEASIAKARRILTKLESTRGRAPSAESEGGISARSEDIFAESAEELAVQPKYDVVTAVGILEYLQGFTCDTTERCYRLKQPEESASAPIFATKLDAMTTDSASLIVNTFRPDPSTRILELFGRRFDYRTRENLSALLAAAHFRESRLVGSGNIYDIEVYEKAAS